MTVFHVFLLVLVCGIANTDTVAVKADSYPGRYDYFSVVFQWPKSFCNEDGVICTRGIPNYFTVHGTWPQLCSGDDNCCYSAYKLNYATHYCNSAINSNYDKQVCNFMINNWPNLKSPRDNHRFWDHEYQKHGSCFPPFQLPFQNPWFYFQKTFDMANLISYRIGSVTNALSQAGIHPGDTKLVSEFENAIFVHLKFHPRVRFNYYRRSGIRQLYEIEFCFNSHWALIDCRSNSICGNWNGQGDPSVWFPPL